jgi:hypothetical protein
MSMTILPHLGAKPYGERDYVDRNEVVHRNTNPFYFAMSAGPHQAYFWLDSRDTSRKSTVSVDADMANMLAVVERGCALAMSLL